MKMPMPVYLKPSDFPVKTLHDLGERAGVLLAVSVDSLKAMSIEYREQCFAEVVKTAGETRQAMEKHKGKLHRTALQLYHGEPIGFCGTYGLHPIETAMKYVEWNVLVFHGTVPPPESLPGRGDVEQMRQRIRGFIAEAEKI